MPYYLAGKEMTQQLNDRLRKYGDQSLGKLVCTRSITALSGQGMIDVINAVREYDDWPESKDPYGEHDYGSFEVNGESYIWKIDYMDPTLTMGCEPSQINNTAHCRRVLTIMRSDEY